MSTPRPLRGSFQQLLLLAFVLIALLLGGIALRTVYTFDQLMAQSSGFAQRALQLSAAAQMLAERNSDLERAARQSLVLNDSLLRKRFDDTATDARRVLHILEPDDITPTLATSWRRQLTHISTLLDGPSDTALERERAVAQEFRTLDALNGEIAQGVQRAITERNQALQAQLDASRGRAIRLVVGAVALALLMAVALGVWLGRPFKRLERAIVGLGENRLHDPIQIRGPADVRRVGQRLEWLRLRLTELDADKARFLRHISHELKTPLAAMREGVALLQDEVAGPLTDNQREVTGILHQNTVVLQNQIEALLRFNAAAFEARQLKRAKTDLRQLLDAQVEAQRLQWQAHSLRVRVEGEPVTAQVDADKLATAVANLLSNAIRFSPHGGTIQIQLARVHDGERGEGRVHITLRDEGLGIAPADRERIFEPFYRGAIQPANAARGTGIGLSIVQEYIAAHGGQLSLLPHHPGAHFRIELPHAI